MIDICATHLGFCRTVLLSYASGRACVRAAANGPTNGELYKYNINRRLDEMKNCVLSGLRAWEAETEIRLFAGRPPAAAGYASVCFPTLFRLYLYALGKASADMSMPYWKWEGGLLACSNASVRPMSIESLGVLKAVHGPRASRRHWRHWGYHDTGHCRKSLIGEFVIFLSLTTRS